MAETRYFRSDTRSVNTKLANRLDTSNSASSDYVEASTNSVTTTYSRFNIFILDSAGGLTSLGTNQASCPRYSVGAGIQSANWSCPETELVGTDAVYIYAIAAAGALSTASKSFVTGQLGASKLDSATWTIYRYDARAYSDPTTFSRLYWGDSTKETKITNFSWTEEPSIYDLSCTDGVSLGETTTAGAVMNVACSESVSMGDAQGEYSLCSYSLEDALKLSSSPNYFSCPFVIDPEDIDSDQTDFPVLLNISSSCGKAGTDITSIFDVAGENYLKVHIKDSSGTECYTEVVSWDTVNRKAELHFKLPAISSSVETTFTLEAIPGLPDNSTYVGITGSTPAQSVWSNDFVFVSHMNDQEGGTKIYDSTSSANHGTKGAGDAAPTEVDGLIGKAQSFPEGFSYIKLPVISLPAPYTHESYQNITGGQVNYAAIGGESVSERFMIYTSGGDPKRVLHQNKTGWYSDYRIYLGEWFSYAFTDNGTNQECFIDGTTAGTGAYTNDLGSSEWYIFSYGNETYYNATGDCGEYRISSTARSAGWISTTNKTLRDILVTAGNITSTPSMGAYPLGADTVNISDTTGILGWAYPTASDTFLFSGDPSEYILASVLGASGFALSDFPEEYVISDVSCSDGFLLSALINQLCNLYPEITDSVVLSDMARAYLKAYRIIQTISARARTNPSNWRPIVDEGNNRNLK